MSHTTEAKSIPHSQAAIRSIDILEPFFVRRIPLWKRTMDIIGAVLGLILFAPLMLCISLLIKMLSTGPILFKQERVGFGGELFKFLKFRTMKVGVDPTKHQQYYESLIKCSSSEDNSEKCMAKLDGSNPDIILFGRILRSTCLPNWMVLILILYCLVGFSEAHALMSSHN